MVTRNFIVIVSIVLLAAAVLAQEAPAPPAPAQGGAYEPPATGITAPAAKNYPQPANAANSPNPQTSENTGMSAVTPEASTAESQGMFLTMIFAVLAVTIAGYIYYKKISKKRDYYAPQPAQAPQSFGQ